LPSYPQGDLETPFLKEELFVGESEAGWEARVAALEAESPFQSALEQDQTTLIEAKEMEAEMLAEELVEEGKQAVSAHFPVEQADSYSEEAEQSADLVDGLNAEKFSEEEDELEEVLTDEEEEESRAVDEILSGLDRAVSLNRRYGEELGWRIQDDTIARFLGFIDYSPDEKTFAEAIARWQRSQSLKGDGILGPETWARLRAALPADNRERFPARSQPTSFIPTPVEAPGGERIKDLTEPRQAELTTVEGFGGKPVELHRLTAEAWTALVQAARSDGFGAPLLLPISGYRSVKRQEVLWQEALRKYGSREEARKWVAPPGGSAHQTGRAIDFYLGGKNSSENAANLRKLSVYRWLVANAARFGFYPYEREPWHWEYNPPAHRHEQEQGESVLLKESDEFPERLDEEEDEPTREDTEAESLDLDRAVQLNRQYAQSLGWQAHFDRIVRFLGFVTYTPDERAFAEAAARWQRSQGLSDDGIIGPTTWARMRALLGLTPPQPAAPSPSIAPAGVALTPDQIRVVAQTQWEAHAAIHLHFGNRFDRYLELWPLYNSRGIQNPAGYIVANIVTVSFFGHRTPAHRDMIAPLQQAENTLRARGITPSIRSFWSFNPRPSRGTTSSLSQHAFGRAVDINPEGNPLIADRYDIQVIEAVTGVDLGRPQPAAVMREASLAFRRSFNQQWIDQLQQQKGREDRQQLLQAVQKRRRVLDSYARTGFFNLEQTLVDALIEAGLQWGGEWDRRKDFMHFELGGR